MQFNFKFLIIAQSSASINFTFHKEIFEYFFQRENKRKLKNRSKFAWQSLRENFMKGE